MAVKIFEEFPGLKVSGKRKVNTWINYCVSLEHWKAGAINIILVNDKQLLEINRNYLHHNYYTDIITFNYNQKDVISGDLYISIERIVENAKHFSVSEVNELLRVIIHGVLHLMGYDDKKKMEQEIMREKEDLYLQNIEEGSIKIHGKI